MSAALVIAAGVTISCDIATAVTGDAAGVASANSEIINSNATIAIGDIPTAAPKLTRNEQTASGEGYKDRQVEIPRVLSKRFPSARQSQLRCEIF